MVKVNGLWVALSFILSTQLTFAANAPILVSLTRTACGRKTGMDFELVPTQIPPTSTNRKNYSGNTDVLYSMILPNGLCDFNRLNEK